MSRYPRCPSFPRHVMYQRPNTHRHGHPQITSRHRRPRYLPNHRWRVAACDRRSATMVGLRPVMTEPAFDINTVLFAPGSDLDEEAAHAYEQDLSRLFEESPQGK